MNVNILSDTPLWEWGPKAHGIIAGTLRDRNRPLSERNTAAQLAGDLVVMDDAMAELLVSVVQNREEPVDLRAMAAISLGPVLEQTEDEGFDEDQWAEPPIAEPTFELIKHTLHSVYEDTNEPKEVRRRVLEASVRATADWHEEAVRAAAMQTDSDWKLTSVFCMQYVPGFDKDIVKALDSPDPNIRYEAVRAAGSGAVVEAWPRVTEILSSGTADKKLLIAAIYAAASIRPEEAGLVLNDFLDSDDEEIVEAATDAIAEAQPEGAFDDEDEDDVDSDPWR